MINIKKTIITAEVIIFTIVFSFFIFGDVYADESVTWGGTSTGNAACAAIGRNCTTAYTLTNTVIPCDRNWYTGGHATCASSVVGVGTTWILDSFGNSRTNTGNAACAAIGRNCIKAYNYSGVLQTNCTSSTIGGTALCESSVVGVGTTWTNTSTGNAACTAIGKTCNTAYNYNGVLKTCSTSSSGGTVLCNVPITVTCSADKTSALLNTPVVWTAVASGGSGSYTYSWSGTDSLSGSTVSVSKSYQSVGTKTASVIATSGGNSSPATSCSNNVNVYSLGAPGAPTGLDGSFFNSAMNIFWTAPSSDGGSAITGYKIERSTDGINWTELVANTGNTNTTYSDNITSGLTLDNVDGATATWRCAGLCGVTPICTATRNIGCGTLGATGDGRFYEDGTTAWPVGTFCSVGSYPVIDDGYTTEIPGGPGFPIVTSTSTTWKCYTASTQSYSDRCIANLKINGLCGPAGELEVDGGTAYSETDVFPKGAYCETSSNYINPSPNPLLLTGSRATWVCPGANTGEDSGTCLAKKATGPSVSNPSARLDNCYSDPTNPPAGTGGIYFSWTYNDNDAGNTIPQESSILEIYNNSNLVPSNLVYQSPPSFNATAKTIYVGGAGDIPFKSSGSYYWRVMVSNSRDDSDWSATQSFTTSAHAWPYAVIDVSPEPHIVKKQICISAVKSACYDGADCDYTWTLDYNLKNLTPSKVKEPRICYAYQTIGQRTEELMVCDSHTNPHCCSATASFNVKNTSNVPQWREISPF
ncbi:MAG: hypothetical protein WC711_00665 [Candidatus Staskawiczbacteria bacterium]|jgi:hypothetical protein